MTTTSTKAYVVRRYRGGLVRQYGPFDTAELADAVAQRAAEKHPGHVVLVTEVR